MSEFLYKRESYLIRGAAFEVYKELRNNYKEKVYHNSYFLSLKYRGLLVEKEKRLEVFFKGRKVGIYIPDLIINDKIIIEIKAKPKLTIEDIKQFWYYLKGSKYRLGFLVNFGSNDGVEIIRKVYDVARKI